MTTWPPDRVRALRAALSCDPSRCITQSELAELVGVHRVTVSQWERGHQRPTRLAVRVLDRLSQVSCSASPKSPGCSR